MRKVLGDLTVKSNLSPREIHVGIDLVKGETVVSTLNYILLSFSTY